MRFIRSPRVTLNHSSSSEDACKILLLGTASCRNGPEAGQAIRLRVLFRLRAPKETRETRMLTTDLLQQQEPSGEIRQRKRRDIRCRIVIMTFIFLMLGFGKYRGTDVHLNTVILHSSYPHLTMTSHFCRASCSTEATGLGLQTLNDEWFGEANIRKSLFPKNLSRAMNHFLYRLPVVKMNLHDTKPKIIATDPRMVRD